MSRINLFLFLLFFVVCFSKVEAQNPQIVAKYSEPLSVYLFVEQVSNKSGVNDFKSLFLNSTYNQTKYTALLAQFDTLIFNYSYEFQEYPYTSILPGMTESLIKKNLLASANLKDFKKLTTGLIPNENLSQLTTILYEFQDVYRALVYKPNKLQFEKQLSEISNFIKSKKISAFFENGISFYKTYWDVSVPFEIAFYPQLGTGGYSANAFCNSAVCGLKLNSKDYSLMMGIILHEVFHVLYNEQSLLVKKNILQWFNESPFNSSTYAYLLLNEVLATTLGNGFVFEMLTGNKDESNWYNRKYIDLMAKKIYPLALEYMIQKKTIDQVFVSSYINLYEESFPEWLNEMDNLMCYRYVLSDNKNDFTIIQKNYPYASFSNYEDVVNAISVERMRAYPLTKMIIVSETNEEKLSMIKTHFKELADWKFKAKVDFIHSWQLTDKTKLIIINNVKGSTEKVLNGRVLLPPETNK